jgi:hypothetical protein
MQELERAVIEHKEDIWKIPESCHIVYVNCALEHYSARELIERCRDIQKIVFSGPAYALTNGETKEFLKENAFVFVRSAVRHHGIDEAIEKEIKNLYASGHYTLHRLSEKFRLSEHTLLHIIHDKPPVYVRRKGKRKDKKGRRRREVRVNEKSYSTRGLR